MLPLSLRDISLTEGNKGALTPVSQNLRLPTLAPLREGGWPQARGEQKSRREPTP